MFFDDDLDEIFGRPYDGRRGRGTTRSLMRQMARQNPSFREFSRDPRGRAVLNTASLLARLGLESINAQASPFDVFEQDFDFTNTATRSGKLTGRGVEMAAADIALDLIGGLLAQAFARRKVTNSISESDRSRQAQKLWKSSRSDRDAMLARIVQRGMGQL